MGAGPGQSSVPNASPEHSLDSKPTTRPLATPAQAPSNPYNGSGQFSPCLTPDPRTSSTQSLVSSVSDSDQRRTLLLIYIHGFYGNDQSFRSFPFHVHSFLKNALAETHIIHSKIYPRYKTYRAIEIARDNFSQWLAPHESPTTDIILVGHSMGGILAADVVLMPNRNPYNHHPYKHRILGTISLDSPFLGLHPGIVVSGISSLFKPSPEPPTDRDQGDGTSQSASSSTSHLQSPQSGGIPTIVPPKRQPTDPHFNAPFFNDNPFKEAPFVKRIMHFARKHRSEGIVNATAKHVLSHLEYGGCLADFHGLNVRYNRIRHLEDIDELGALHGGPPVGNEARVRFVNYYTLSSGRKKRSTSPSNQNPTQDLTPVTSKGTDGESLMSRETTRDTRTSISSFSASNVSISVEDYSDCGGREDSVPASERGGSSQRVDDSRTDRDAESIRTGIDTLSMQEIEPLPIPDEVASAGDQELDLPPIPELPSKPSTPDFEQYADKDARKQAEKEFRRVKRNYEQAIKDRNKAIREREKLLEKRRRKAEKEEEKLESVETNDSQLQDPTEDAPSARGEGSLASHAESVGEEPRNTEAKRPKKNKKFCTLPRKVNGERDSTWVDIYMDDMDEVSAHCGLFFPGPHYERLIGDVGTRVVGWVQDDLTKRTILEMEREQ